MKKSYNKTIQQFNNLAILFLSFIFCFVSTVSAQELPKQSALGVSPAILELVLTPGKKQETKVTVINITNFPLPIKGFVRNFIIDDPSVELTQEKKEIFDASAWIKLEPADFILQPLENKEVKIIISPPKKAEPGGHYATIYFQPLIPQEVASSSMAYLTARVGVLTMMIVRGDIKEQATIGNLGVLLAKPLGEGKHLLQYGPLELQIAFKNKGNVHLVPTGEVVVKEGKKEVAKIRLPLATVLPQTLKYYQIKWDKKYLFGQYTAQARFIYGTEKLKLESNPVEIFVVPWVLILCLISLLTIIILFLTIVRRRIILAVKVLFGKAEVRGEDLLTYKQARMFKRKGRPKNANSTKTEVSK